MCGENLNHACVYPLQLSSGVNSLAPLFFFYCFKTWSNWRHGRACLSDCCFLGNGKWNKETQKGQQCRTANYEQEGEGEGGRRRRRGVSHTAAMCPPLTPSSHSPAPPSSNPLLFVSCCDLFVAPSPFIFGVVTSLCSAPLSLIITSDNCGEAPSMGTGLTGPLHVHADGRE